MICSICKTRFADFPETDFILDLPAPPGEGIIARSKEAHERRMKVFWSDEERFCSEECSDAFMEEVHDRAFERLINFSYPDEVSK